MGLKDVDIGGALRRLADRRIEEAMREGKFDNLPGAGQPIELEPMPANEDARMTWWALRILRKNEFIPDELRLRKAVDYLRTQLDSLVDEARLASIVHQLNDLVKKINTLGTNAMVSGMAPVDLEQERRKLLNRRGRGAA